MQLCPFFFHSEGLQLSCYVPCSNIAVLADCPLSNRSACTQFAEHYGWQSDSTYTLVAVTISETRACCLRLASPDLYLKANPMCIKSFHP